MESVWKEGETKREEYSTEERRLSEGESQTGKLFRMVFIVEVKVLRASYGQHTGP